MFMLSKFSLVSMICIVMPSIIRFSRYDLIVIKFNGFVTNSHIDFVRNCLEKAADACLCLFSIYLPDFVCKMMIIGAELGGAAGARAPPLLHHPRIL